MDKTYRAKPGEVLQSWHQFDADGAVLGRMASRIAVILQGKHHARYTPETDTGDFVVVTNASKVYLSGNKADDRMLRWHTGFMGGLREMSSGEMRDRHPDRLVYLAVRRMMPKTRMGRKMLKKLKIFPGVEHTHEAQKPVAVDMTNYLPKQDS